jgi:O-antigen/teichoic acid export membrane protein
LSGIRATYSGLISFGITMMNVLLGLVFMLIITRTLSVEDYGIWNIIVSIISYSLIVEPIISFWATREIARGVKTAKTAIFSNGVFAIFGVLIYLAISHYTNNESNLDIGILWFAVFLVPLTFIFKSMQAVTLATKPHMISIAQTVSIVTKIPLALYLLYFMEFGIEGIIFVHAAGLISSIIIMLIFSHNEFKSKLQIKFLKKWIQFSWLALYPRIPVFLQTLDMLIFIIITNSVSGIAYFSVAMVVSGLVTYSDKFSQPMYAKLLGGGTVDQIQNNFTRFFYFAFPLASISIVFARPGLFALNPSYEIGIFVVIALSLKFLIISIKTTLSIYLKGNEKVDNIEGSNFRDHIKSQLFFLPTLSLIQYSTYLIVLVIGLILLSDKYTEIQLVTYWAVIGLIIEIPITIYLYFKFRKLLLIKLEKIMILKYLVSCIIVFGGLFIIIEKYLSYSDSIFVFIPNLLLFVIYGIMIYLGLTFMIDVKTRIFAKSIFLEIIKKR